MLEQMKEMLRMVMEDDELFELMAQILKKSHSALITAGFSEEQATTIIASQGSGIKAN